MSDDNTNSNAGGEGQAPAAATIPGAGGDGAASPAPANGQAPGATGAAPSPSAAYRPEGLPDHLLGASDKETIDRLYGAYKPAREAISALGEVPKEPTGYQFTPSEKVAPFVGDLEKDQFFTDVKAIAHEHRIPDKQLTGFLNKVMERMVDQHMVADPFDADKERAAMFPDVEDPKERAILADALVKDNAAQIDVWRKAGMPTDVADWLESHFERATAHKLMDFIRERSGEVKPALNERRYSGAVSETDIDARMADPRNDPNSGKYVRAFAEETLAMQKKLWGG